MNLRFVNLLPLAARVVLAAVLALMPAVVPAQVLSALIAEADRAAYHTGICVWDLTADSLLAGYNSHKVMRPASTQKMLTAVAALSTLGAGHEFATRAYHTGEVTADSTLAGDVYVVGDFDPLFSIDDLRQMALAIKRLGVKRIAGGVYGDAGMKAAKELYGNGWCWDDVPCSTAPPLCALMVEKGKAWPRFKDYSKEFFFNPALDFARALSDELRKAGVAAATFDTKEMPAAQGRKAQAPKLVYTTTHTIEQVMQRMMKNSDNLHAEAVFYQLAHHAGGRHCTWRDGARQVTAVMRQAGVNTAQVEVADGSGVSLYNYVSPAAQVAMLRYAYRHDAIFTYLYNSMPVAGTDGSLASRMKSGAACGNVHAKTGTVEGCSTLAGYVTAANGHLLAFSIMNNGVLSSQTGRDFQDRVCQELAR